MKYSKDLSRAKNYAFRLIKFRVRSEKELRDKLKNKEYPKEVIEETVNFLKEHKFIDDALFAKLWVQSRIKKPLGFRRLEYELKFKGVDKKNIENALSEACQNYNEEETVREIVENKIKRMKNVAPEKIKARLFGLLLRKGYPQDLVIEAIEKYIN